MNITEKYKTWLKESDEIDFKKIVEEMNGIIKQINSINEDSDELNEGVVKAIKNAASITKFAAKGTVPIAAAMHAGILLHAHATGGYTPEHANTHHWVNTVFAGSHIGAAALAARDGLKEK